MQKFLYFLLGVLSSVAVTLGAVLGHQAGVLPIPGPRASVSASPSRVAPKLVAKPTHAPTHKPKVTHTPPPARTAGSVGDVYDAYCKDGTITHKAGHSGACSHHGGLA